MILNLTTNDVKIIRIAVPALRIAGLGQVFYATGVVLSNGLQSAGKSLFVMLSEVIVNWLSLSRCLFFRSLSKLGIVAPGLLFHFMLYFML